MDMVGNGLGRWNTMPTCRRTITGSTPDAYRSFPSIVTSPFTCAPGITSCIRFRVRRNVDLPHPEGPMKAVTVRGSMVIETPSTARKSP